VGTVDDLCGDAAAGEAAVVDAFEVVFVEVVGAVAFEAVKRTCR